MCFILESSNSISSFMSTNANEFTLSDSALVWVQKVAGRHQPPMEALPTNKGGFHVQVVENGNYPRDFF